MEFYEVKKLNQWYFSIKLPYSDRYMISYTRDTSKYIFHLRRYVKSKEIAYLYNNELDDGVFEFQIGFAGVIHDIFQNELPIESKMLLQEWQRSELQIPEFFNLRSHQNSDLTKLLQLNRGIFQTYTGYGKSEVISTLANHLANNLGKTVLIVTASGPSLNEITYRLYSKFGIELDYFDYESRLNCFNVNGFLRSYQYNPNHEYWSQELIILADEVENCLTETAMEFYETLPNVTHMYGFSATADKKFAQAIRYQGESGVDRKLVNDILGRNQYLIGYFGQSTVYKRPDSFNIKLIDILSSISADVFHLPDEYDYNGIVYGLFSEDRMCKLIESIAFKLNLLFIPMFRLEIIDHWLDNYFKKKDYIVLCISSRGYELYECGELIAKIDLATVKNLVKLGLINLVIGTKSSYNALDIPELNRILLLYSKVANVVIQAIGRTARGGDFEVYNINPTNIIPTYTNDLKQRKVLIKEYYKDCNIIEYSYNENMFLC